jgi:hypothetical protein
MRAADAERRAIMLASSQKKYDDELAYPWDNYFGVDLTPYLTGARCSTSAVSTAAAASPGTSATGSNGCSHRCRS